MSSASRKSALAAVMMSVSLACLADLSAVALAKVEVLANAAERERRRTEADPNELKATYDGRVAFTRIRYGSADLGSGRFRREPTWAHDFPRAEYNFQKILSELTFVPTFIDQGNVRTLDDPELGMFPIAYMSEPGFWTMTDAERAALKKKMNSYGKTWHIWDTGHLGHPAAHSLPVGLVRPGGSYTPIHAARRHHRHVPGRRRHRAEGHVEVHRRIRVE